MNVKMLKEEMAKNSITQRKLAKLLGMSESTFRRKMKNNKFGLLDANIMIDVLNIECPGDIFFSSTNLTSQKVGEDDELSSEAGSCV